MAEDLPDDGRTLDRDITVPEWYRTPFRGCLNKFLGAASKFFTSGTQGRSPMRAYPAGEDLASPILRMAIRHPELKGVRVSFWFLPPDRRR